MGLESTALTSTLLLQGEKVPFELGLLDLTNCYIQLFFKSILQIQYSKEIIVGPEET